MWEINKYLIGQFMYKHFRVLLPKLFDTFFKRVKAVHFHFTKRSSLFYHAPIPKSEYRKISISYRGPSIWNSIMEKQISPAVGLATFKFHLKNLLLNGDLWVFISIQKIVNYTWTNNVLYSSCVCCCDQVAMWYDRAKE